LNGDYGCGVPVGAFVAVIEETMMVFGEQDAELALMLLLTMLS